MTDPTRDEEKRLVEHAKRDPREFGALYDRHFQQIYRFVYSRVREQTAAEDVTSEVFMKALKAMPRYQDTGRPFAAWLYQIAVNAIADRYRTLRPAQPLEDFHDLSVAGPAIEEQAAQRDEVRRILNPHRNPHQTVGESNLQPALRGDGRVRHRRGVGDQRFDAAKALGERHQLHAMGKTPGAVKLLIHRGVSRLRDEAGVLRPLD